MRTIKNFLNFDISFIKKEGPSIVFVFIALTAGLVFVKNVGTLVGPDMLSAHYKAALATATGQVFKDPIEIEYGKRHLIQGEEKYFLSGGKDCNGGAFVSHIVDDPFVSDKKNACVREHDKQLSENKIAETDAILQYPIFAYMPQGLALAIGMGVDMEPVYAQTLARVFNLVVYIAIILIAIRLVGKGKWLITTIAVLPTSLFLASSMSADAMNIAWSFLFVAYVLKLYTQNETATRKQSVILMSLGLGLFVLKIAYAPLLLLIFALGGKVLSHRRAAIVFFGTSLIGSVLYLVWSSQWSSLNAMVDVSNNFQAVLNNLLATITGIALNVLHVPVLLLEMQEPMYGILAIAIFMLIARGLRGTKPADPTRLFDLLSLYRLQFLALFAAVFIFAITYAALLITWTDLSIHGFLNIQGFQGRYVLPALPLLLTLYYLPQKQEIGEGVNE